MPSTDSLAELTDAYTAEITAMTEAVDRFLRFTKDAFADGQDPADKLKRAQAMLMASAGRTTLAGFTSRESYGDRHESILRGKLRQLAKLTDEHTSFAATARNAVMELAIAGHYSADWPIFARSDFGDCRSRASFRDDRDHRPPGTGELFAEWATLRADHPLRDAFKDDELMPVKFHGRGFVPCVVLTDNKAIATERPNTPQVFELDAVRRLTKAGRSAALTRQREEAEREERERLAAEKAFRESPEGRIATLEAEVASLRQQLASK